jgi:hypothetical protein
VNLIPTGFDFAGTPLHYAALRGHRAMVDQLLRRGTDCTIPDRKIGKLAEDWAQHDGHAERAEYLRRVRGSGPAQGGGSHHGSDASAMMNGKVG